MRQAIITIIFGAIGTWFAQWLSEIHRQAQEIADKTGEYSFTAWAADFSNGDVLGLIQILLICYLYARVREIQRAVPELPTSSKPLVVCL